MDDDNNKNGKHDTGIELEDEDLDVELGPIERLTRDLAKAAKTLSAREARYLVDAYYMMQEHRITSGHRIRTLDAGSEPHLIIDWFQKYSYVLESQLKRALSQWSGDKVVGVWARSICGIGPVISAGLLAHVDIIKSPTVGHIWSFAGLNPDMVWEPKTPRPYNADFKSLCAYKIGESFVKVQNRERDIYGKVFAMRKKLEIERNEAFTFAPLAAKKVGTVDKKTDAYKWYVQGKLPPAHIHARARRYAVKLFLAHYHMVAYFHHYKTLPPFPYAFSHLKDHVHFIQPPNPGLIDGLAPALAVYEEKMKQR